MFSLNNNFLNSDSDIIYIFNYTVHNEFFIKILSYFVSLIWWKIIIAD